VDEAALLLLQGRPLLLVGGQIDCEGRPLRILPAAVQSARALSWSPASISRPASGPG
jgi:hypothetical protein